MSVELEKKIIKNHRTLTAVGTKTSMDNDIIVPDTQPDVKAVLQAEALPMICEKRVQKDYIILTGNMDYTIIYLSDEKDAHSSVKSISTRIPFTHQIEAAGAHEAAFSGVKPEVISINASTVNSRKINVKTTIDFESNLIAYDDFEAVCSASGEGEIPCKNREIETFALSAYCENEFELSDALSVPSGSEMIDELLKVDVKINSREIKSISGKPVAKGSMDVCALYTDTAGEIRCINGEIPFTEILSVDDVGIDDICEAEYSLTDLQYSAAADSDGDLSIMDIRACVNIAACVYRKDTDYITEDMYSPDFDISVAADSIKTNRLTAGIGDSSSIKDVIKLSHEDFPISKVYNVTVKPRINSAEIKSGKASISGTAETCVMYISTSESSPVCSITREIPFSYSVSAPCSDDAKISVLCDADGINFSTLSSGEAEVSFVIDFDTKIITEETVSYIKDAVAEGKNRDETVHKAGLVIYFASAGECMWDIAKRYRTTFDAITSANGCEFPEVLTETKRIMIPKRRAV